MIDQAELRRRAFDFVIDVHGIDAMDVLVKLLCAQIAPYRLGAAASGFVSGARAASAIPFHFANWPAEWMAHYRAQDFVLIDPSVRWARNSGRALSWRELFQMLSPRDPGQKVVKAAASFGFNEGMIVPTRSGDNSLGLVCFGGMREALNRKEQALLTIVARAAFEAAERILHAGDIGRPAPFLTVREVECLALLVRGRSDQEIADQLGLSRATVRFHIGNAREKSGAPSRGNLIALAIAQGFVTP